MWDVSLQRAAGMTVQVLRPVGWYSILAHLFEDPCLHPAELCRLLITADAADAPMVGARGFDLHGVSHRLTLLRACGLIINCDGCAAFGAHTSYQLTYLGAGMVESLAEVTQWGLDHFDLALAAARVRAHLGRMPGTVDPALRRPRQATGMALGMLAPRWSFSLLVQVGIAGDRGVESGAAQDAINGILDGMPERVRLHLNEATRHRVLRYLESSGLVVRRREARFGRRARVLYCPTDAGARLVDALRTVGKWAVAHDGALSAAVMATSPWFEEESV